MLTTTPNAGPLDTARTEGFRELQFKSLDDVLAEVERLASANREGRLVCTGNWSLGQNLGHLAAWINYAFDGGTPKPPWPIKMIIRWFMKRKFLVGPMPRGVRIPRITGGTLATDPMSTEDGLARFRSACDRLRRSCPSRPNPIFGPLSHDQWIRMNLRHAELHLGFMRIQG